MEAEFARGSKSEVGGLKRYICVDLCLFAVVFGLGEACGGEKRLATGLGGQKKRILTANGRKWTRMRPENGNFSRKTGNGQENRRGNFPKSEVRGPRSEVRGRRSGRGRRRGGQLRNARIARKWGLEMGLGGRETGILTANGRKWTRMGQRKGAFFRRACRAVGAVRAGVVPKVRDGLRRVGRRRRDP